MGRGKKLQDFRKYNSSISDKEFVIEVNAKTGRVEKEAIEQRKNKQKVKKQESKILRKESYIGKQEAIKKPKDRTKGLQDSLATTYQKEEINKNLPKRTKTSHVVAAFLLLFTLVGVVAGCLVTPTFEISQIEVPSGKHVAQAEILNCFSGVKGKNIFLVDKESLESEIQKIPYIVKATVSRKLPNKLVVNYYERKPYALLKYIESYVVMDKYGTILEVVSEKPEEELPILYGMSLEEVVPGQKLEKSTKLKFENSVYLLETFEHLNTTIQVSEINYSDSEEIRLSIRDKNIEVIYGKIEREILSDKVAYLEEILQEPKLIGKKGTLDISSDNYEEKVIFSEILR